MLYNRKKYEHLVFVHLCKLCIEPVINRKKFSSNSFVIFNINTDHTLDIFQFLEEIITTKVLP